MRAGPEPAPLQVLKGPIALIGDGLVAHAALHALVEHGVHDAHLVQPNVLGVGMPGVDGPASWPPPGASSPPPRICVLCADVVDPRQVLELNARCLDRRTKLVPGLVMGSVGQVGPVVIAGRSACLHCVDLRLRATSGRTFLFPYGPPDPLIAALVGRELARRVLTLAAGDDPDPRLSFHWADGSSTCHRPMRTWHCPSCSHIGPQPGFLLPGGLPTDDGRAAERSILDLEARLVDPVTGPIRSIEPFEPGPDDPPLRHWVASLSEPGRGQAVGMSTLLCGGNNLDDDAARAAALGEAAERMSACQPAPADLLVAPYDEVLADAVNPRIWDLFDEATRSRPGFPYPDIGSDDDLSWAWAWSLTRGRPALVPASRVFVPFEPRTAADNADHPTLSGFAAGTTLVTATLAALLEVIERDAFMIAWMNHLQPPRLELDRRSPHGVGAYVAAFEDLGIEVRCDLLMLDLGVPTVLAMARRSRSDDPAIVVATAADLDVAAACRHALAELAANRLYVRHTMAPPSPLSVDALQAADVAGHGRLYADPDMAAHVDFWWNSGTSTPLQSTGRPLRPDAALRRVVQGISAVGLETVAVDITPPELRQLGLTVVKALVPGTYPLTFGCPWPHLGGHRLRRAPVTAGYLRAPLPAASLNRLPHPFP